MAGIEDVTATGSKNTSLSPVTAAQSSESHQRSDVDSGKHAQHHTIGIAPNQSSAGNHTHRGDDSLVIPEIAGILTNLTNLNNQMFPGRVTWNPAWWSSGVQPAINNGTLIGDYMNFGPILIWTMWWKRGSTTVNGTGDYSFSMPAPVAGIGAINTTGGYLYNNNHVYPVTGLVRGGNLDRIVAASAKGEGQPYLGGAGWNGAWITNDEINLQGWAWRY